MIKKNIHLIEELHNETLPVAWTCIKKCETKHDKQTNKQQRSKEKNWFILYGSAFDHPFTQHQVTHRHPHTHTPHTHTQTKETKTEKITAAVYYIASLRILPKK